MYWGLPSPLSSLRLCLSLHLLLAHGLKVRWKWEIGAFSGLYWAYPALDMCRSYWIPSNMWEFSKSLFPKVSHSQPFLPGFLVHLLFVPKSIPYPSWQQKIHLPLICLINASWVLTSSPRESSGLGEIKINPLHQSYREPPDRSRNK